MPRRQSNESRVLQYFRTAPQAEMELVYGLVQGEVRARRLQAGSTLLKPKPKKKTNSEDAVVTRDPYRPYNPAESQ